MKSYHRKPLFYVCLLASLASSASAQAPPNVVQSDSNENTAAGSSALASFQGGANNTALGFDALSQMTLGRDSTAIGAFALAHGESSNSNTAVGSEVMWVATASGNTGVGTRALQSLTEGADNVAIGAEAMLSNTTGKNNVALGRLAMSANTTGESNVAAGYQALFRNTTGSDDIAVGISSLQANLTGARNIAIGTESLAGNTVGNNNTAFGDHSLRNTTTGSNNTAVGDAALVSNGTGGNNIALGYYAGSNITAGYRNIDIGNVGTAGDAGTIRIGTSGQHTATYVAGISGAHVTGSAVYISSTGQLGVLASSERYKTAIAPMGPRSAKLQQLRPVTFQLKTDRTRALQYGLIAEEVARVYPELVVRDEAGQIEGVRYEELAPMLLNEVQQQQAQMSALKQRLTALEQGNRLMQTALHNLQAEVTKPGTSVGAEDEF